MTLKEKILYHQIHPLKLTADVVCEPVSLYLLWQHNLVLGLATHFIPPIVASWWLICYGDLEVCKASTFGGYIRRHMTRTVESVRFAGDIVAVLGAWFHEPSFIVFGLVAIIFAWCSGLARKPASN